MKRLLLAGAALALAAIPAAAKDLKAMGVSVGSLGNPFFVQIAKGAEFEAKKVNPEVKVTAVASDYDLNKQFTQVENFIAAGVDLILINAADPVAIEPAVKKAQAAGIIVVAIDVNAKGADATVTTNNVQAGEIACQFLADKIGHKGDVVIVNGPQVSAVTDRVKGCKQELAKHSDIKIVSDNQDAKGSRDGGLQVMQGLLTRFETLAGVFAINDPTAIGADLAAKQLGRKEFVITAVDGAPDVEVALKSDTLIQASSSQDPFAMARRSVQVGVDLLNGKKPAQDPTLIPPALVTRDNVKDYKGWTSEKAPN